MSFHAAGRTEVYWTLYMTGMLGVSLTLVCLTLGVGPLVCLAVIGIAIPFTTVASIGAAMCIAFGTDAPQYALYFDFVAEAVPEGHGWRVLTLRDRRELFDEPDSLIGSYKLELVMGRLNAREGLRLKRTMARESLRHGETYADPRAVRQCASFIRSRTRMKREPS
jgi:hypothetical protein